MKHRSKYSLLIKAKFVLLISIFVILNSCKEEPILWKVDSAKQVIADYVANNPEDYSEFNKLIQMTGMEALLKVRGPFTVFLPTDEAMLDYYAFKNVNALEDFSADFLEELILYHTVGAEIGANDIGLGALREKNAVGDYLTSEFVDSDIMIHKFSKIIDRDIPAANGYIQVIDRVIDPVVADIYSVVAADPSYTIFSEGLSITGLKDTLQLISFPFGISDARTRFTVLAVADTIYHRYGINSVGDLIEWCGANPDSVTYLNNAFYRYMEYHCLNNSYYLSDLETGVYPILSRDNNVAFTVDTDYKINFDNISKAYTGFIIPASNTPAKNGALHAINDILPAVEPAPASVSFEATDFFDLTVRDYYQNYYERFFDGENSFEKIKFRGDYLLYYYQENNSAIRNGDCLSMQGWWEIAITFPKVMKGKYEVSLFQPAWGDITDCAVYLDGERTNYTYTGPFGTGPGGLQKVADAEFETTEEHTITLRNVSAGMVFWDYIQFDPVK